MEATGITFDCDGRRCEHPPERYDTSCEQGYSQSLNMDAPSPSDRIGISGLYEGADEQQDDTAISVSGLGADSLFTDLVYNKRGRCQQPVHNLSHLQSRDLLDSQESATWASNTDAGSDCDDPDSDDDSQYMSDISADDDSSSLSSLDYDASVASQEGTMFVSTACPQQPQDMLSTACSQKPSPLLMRRWPLTLKKRTL